MQHTSPFTLCLAFAIASLALPGRAAENEVSSPAERNGQELVGKWLRPDGGYVIEISAATADGKLEAGYFNPRPINVSRAAWRFGGGRLQVFVELRDQGYPGATYILHYDPETDQLLGEYTQPAAQQTFDVVFTRLPIEGK